MCKAQKNFSIMVKIVSQFRVILQNAPTAEVMFSRLGTIDFWHEQGINPLQLADNALIIAKQRYPQFVSRLMVESVKPINYGYFAIPDMSWTEQELAITNKKPMQTTVLPESDRATNIGSKFDSARYLEDKKFQRRQLAAQLEVISHRIQLRDLE